MGSTTLTLSSSTTDFVTYLDHPIELEVNRKYEAAFLSLFTYNTIPNVTGENNEFQYYNGVEWRIIKLPVGAYEISEINNEIQRQMIQNDDYDKDNNSFYTDISYTKPTSKSTINIKHDDYIVKFSNLNSIGSILGFGKIEIKKGFHESINVINIEPVNAILVHCNIISGSYVNGHLSQVIHSFTPNVSPGYKIIETPRPQLIFYPVNNCTKIFEIRIWLTDQDNGPINLSGETITVTIRIQPASN